MATKKKAAAAAKKSTGGGNKRGQRKQKRKPVSKENSATRIANAATLNYRTVDSSQIKLRAAETVKLRTIK